MALGVDWSGILPSGIEPTTETPVAEKTTPEKNGAPSPARATVTAQLGSTPEEIDRAVFLCERGGGSESACAREVSGCSKASVNSLP